uniref:Ubiquitin-like domain-containing protein n=1 Tax=viral metagenome TaxID=1070528 RepID=A0A6C0J671_9ZZZZ
MIINVELLLDDNYDIIKIDVKNFNELTKYVFLNHTIKKEHQIWYFNNKKLVNDFIIKKGNYTVTNANANNNMISLRIYKSNNIIRTPYLPIDLTIKELKSILSTRENVYFNNINLNNNNTIGFYKLKDNNLLLIKSIIRVENV